MGRVRDIVIAGGGVAGLTSAMYASRAEKDTVLYEKSVLGGQITLTFDVENYPGIMKIGGLELVKVMEEQAKSFGAEFLIGSVSDIRRDGEFIKMKIDNEDEVIAKSVIVATGSSIRKLNVPGEEEYTGRGVSYCAVCDGAFFKDMNIAVIGGGDAAVEESVFLTRYAKKVTLIHRREKLRATKIIQKRFFENPKTAVIWNSVVKEIKGTDFVKSIVLRNVIDNTEQELPVDGVFIFIGHIPNSDVFGQPIEKDESGLIKVNHKMETSLPGVFAAGEVRSGTVKQLSSSVGDGATAAINADKYVTEFDEKIKTLYYK